MESGLLDNIGSRRLLGADFLIKKKKREKRNHQPKALPPLVEKRLRKGNKKKVKN